MKNEAEFKRAFKKSVKDQGGFALSIAAPMVSGLPDLYVVMPGYAPVLLEAKWIKGIKKTKFRRKVAYTEWQKRNINQCNDVCFGVAYGLVGVEWQHNVFCTLDLEGEVSNDRIWCPYLDSHFDVLGMFLQSRIPPLIIHHRHNFNVDYFGKSV